MSVAAVQEMKWFGSDVWESQGHTFLHSGCPLPSDDMIASRNEGVGIALDERATVAWKKAGEVWNAVSSRIVTARLKLCSAGQRGPSGYRERRDMFITVLSMYAPTAKAPHAIMQKFMDDLQDIIDGICPSDVLLLLGDFSARVGSSCGADDLWEDVRGK